MREELPNQSIAAEFALSGVTVATLVGFTRLFDRADFLGPFLASALLGHLLAALTRRTRSRWSIPVFVAAGVLLAANLTLGATTFYGLPTTRTWHEANRVLNLAWNGLSTVQAPTAPTAGFVLSGILAAWVTAWSSDRLAFRLAAPIEALAPAATLFVFATLLSGPSHRFTSTALFAVFVGLYGLVQRATRLNERNRTLRDVGPLRLSTLGPGTAIVLIVVGVAIVATQVVPGASGPGVLEVRNRGNKEGPRSVVSPLVDIKSQLTTNSDVTLFDVRTAHPTYWRLMALDDFDGQVWSSNQSFTKAGKVLSQKPPNTFPTTTATAMFSLKGLTGSWAPAPYRATSLAGTQSLLWDSATSTLIVDRSRKTVDDLVYQVTAQAPSPSLDPAALRRPGGSIPDDISRRDLELPGDFPISLVSLARETAGNGTPFDKAMALQQYFRDTGGFTYSLAVPPGQGITDINDFITRRVGYCEQFAGTYAAFARAAGLPARVVVGFTSGDPVTGKAGTYEVKGRNAHAWPEVYLAGQGWLPFEPTPGRGNQDAASYTGITPQQAAPQGDPQAAPTSVVPSTPASSLPSSGSTLPGTAPTTTVPLAATVPVVGPPAPHRQNGWAIAAFVVGGLMLLISGVLYGSTRRNESRRRRRRAGASDPATQILVAWAEVAEAWLPHHLKRRPPETHHDFGRRLAEHLATEPASTPQGPSLARRLAELATKAAWRAPDLAAADATEAGAAAETLTRVGRDAMSPLQRFLVRVDPRTPRT